MSTNRNENRTPLSYISESPELFARKREHRSPRRKSSKLTKEEIQYQRFIKDLKRDVQFHLKQSIRESRFDTRSCPSSKTTPSNQFSRSKNRSSRTLSLGTHRSTDTETIVTAISKQQNPAMLLQHNQKKRLEADVQKILTSPAMKLFYNQFIHPSPRKIPQTEERDETIPFVESLFNIS